MFNKRRIDELEAKVDLLEKRVYELAQTVLAQSEEIDKIYFRMEDHAAQMSRMCLAVRGQEAKRTAAEKAEETPKPKRKYRPRKKNGKENPKAEE